MEAIYWIVGIPLALLALFIGLMLAFFFWPLALCWHFGHPILGVIFEIIWLAALNK
jgi:hypothetical protein